MSSRLLTITTVIFWLSWVGLLTISIKAWNPTTILLLGALGASAAANAYKHQRLRRDIRSLEVATQKFEANSWPLTTTFSLDGDIKPLADLVKSLTQKLERRVKVIAQQGSDQEAMLSCMREGLLAFDVHGRVIRLNHSAAQLLALPPGNWVGRTLEEVVSNSRLQRFIRDVLGGKDQIEIDVMLYDKGERFVQSYGNQLLDDQGERLGALIVLNDITKLKQLENVRRDFVANVSHELRTPITSIKGFVETLRDGALENPSDAKRFMGIISRQADRLSAIFDDLLKLARIEIDRDQEQIEFTQCDLLQIARQAIENQAGLAQKKQVKLELQSAGAFFGLVNASLIEQALANLIDNAIRHSDEKITVSVCLEQSQTETVLSVTDRGCGINAKHLPRLFERFYRVDKARSRDSGGTGLGLAIVKHIAQAHGGVAEVQSVLGEGSTFYLRLPRKDVLDISSAG